MPAKQQHDAAATPDLIPPGHTARLDTDEAGHYRWLWIALATVLVLGLVTVFALPALMQSPQQPNRPAASVDTPGVESRNAANQAMQAWLQLRARLELAHAAHWGGPGWSQSQQAADRGARMLAQGQFGEAARHYEQALQGLEQLDSERNARLVTALATASQALASNQLETAVEQFELALAIQADNEDARFGLARSQARPSVLQHMAAGEHAEAGGDLMAAQADYQEAALLDPEYEPPAAAFSRVSAELETVAFQDAMTRALTALDSGRLSVATAALAEASALRPSDVTVIDTQQRLTRTRQQVLLNSLRRQSESLVRDENWQAASTVYSKALALDSTAGFARSGLDKARARLQLNRQFDHYLTKPARLYAVQPLANAEKLLAVAGSAPADEPKLAKKMTRLQRLVTQANTPVTVTLRSDGETDITIYHVGQLGALTSKTIELLPGSYTVTGSRSGYRDIRKQLSVKPGKHETALFIRCEEMI